MNAETILTYSSLFVATLIAVRWFHRSALNEVTTKVKAAIYDESSENSIYAKIVKIESEVGQIRQRVEGVDQRLTAVEKVCLPEPATITIEDFAEKLAALERMKAYG